MKSDKNEILTKAYSVLEDIQSHVDYLEAYDSNAMDTELWKDTLNKMKQIVGYLHKTKK